MTSRDVVFRDRYGLHPRAARRIQKAVADLTADVSLTNLDGSDPQFIWCTILSPVVTEPEDFLETESVELACSGADGCSGFPCSPSAWTNLGSFEVQSSFFVPTAAAQSCNRVGPPECAGVCNTFPSSSCVAIGETCSCVMFPQASPTP